jgi:hypothetical protein
MCITIHHLPSAPGTSRHPWKTPAEGPEAAALRHSAVAGPAIIGLVADKIGLHLALLIPLALATWIAVAAPALRPPARVPDPTQAEPADPDARAAGAGIP